MNFLSLSMLMAVPSVILGVAGMLSKDKATKRTLLASQWTCIAFQFIFLAVSLVQG